MRKSTPVATGLVLSALITAAPPAVGELTVIYEHPGSRPMTDFLNVAGRNTKRQLIPEPPARLSGVMDVRDLLPIHSPGLTPGPVAARAHELPVTQPLFLIGADPLSKAWLARHRLKLESLGAVPVEMSLPHTGLVLQR